MSTLLVRAETFTDRIESFGYDYLSFEARKLAAGQQYAFETGGNELQNYPVLTSSTSDASSVTIAGLLDSTRSTAFDLEFFASAV